MRLILLWGSLLTLFSSCVSHKELVNFDPLNPVTLSPQEINNTSQLTAQPEDLLRITVSSLNVEAAIPFNLPGEDNQRNGGGGQNSGTLQLELTTGYFVDEEGFIDFPVLGPIYVEGMTLSVIKKMLVAKLTKDYLRNPVVNIRFLNLKVTVLGEVNAPGLIRLSNQRFTILEALGLAGDFTSYANRTNVLVVREVDGVRTFNRLDLQREDIFSSPYFYLQQNDFIYVEPITARVATVEDPASRIIRYASAALSLVSLVIAFSR